MGKQCCIPADIMELHPHCFALEVEGDCMAPTVPGGSVIVVDPDIAPPKDGTEIGIVEINGVLHLCRPMRIMGQAILFYDNPKYRSVSLLEKETRVIGALVWVQKPQSQPNVTERQRILL